MQNEIIINASARINELDTDFKAEVVAASLLQYNIAADKIFVQRLGINNRARNKDIIRLKREVFEFNEEHIIIETNRESIYNYMPEGIFHSPTLGGLDKNTADIIEKIRLQKKAEEEGKRFFIPFELETYYTELAALHFENILDQKGSNNMLLEILADLWPLLNELDTATAKIFIYLLPFFHTARGNKMWFEKCMSAFLNVPVVITYNVNQVHEPENIVDLLLSKTILGINTLLCGSHTDGNRNWQINIGPVPAQDVYKYIPGSNFNSVLQSIYSYCLPATVACEQYCVTESSVTSFTLSPIQINENFLGFTTFI